MMWTIFIILCVIMPVIGMKVIPAIQERRRPVLSKVAYRLWEEYQELPQDARPFPDILDHLQELDRLTDGDPDARRDHFDKTYLYYVGKRNGPFEFTWNTGWCYHKDCEYRDYYKIHTAIAAVKKAVREKDRAAGLTSETSALELTRRLRDEADIQREIARQLSP